MVHTITPTPQEFDLLFEAISYKITLCDDEISKRKFADIGTFILKHIFIPEHISLLKASLISLQERYLTLLTGLEVAAIEEKFKVRPFYVEKIGLLNDLIYCL